jgi:hypothetical protein
MVKARFALKIFTVFSLISVVAMLYYSYVLQQERSVTDENFDFTAVCFAADDFCRA